MMRRRALLAVLPLIAGVAAIVPSTPASSRVVAADRSTLTVGDVTLHHCSLVGSKHRSYCGSIKVPLNYQAKHKDGRITAGFGWLPATAPAVGSPIHTIVAEEGGPGYPSTGTAVDYVQMLGKQLLATHNLLLVDERGTGTSTPIDCRAMEKLHIVTTTKAFTHTVHACGRSLDHSFPRRGGGFVHASDLFTTANGTRDMAQVLDALSVHKVDLYGDSYGTYFSQAFMSRFPHRVRSVTLDSAYEARDLDPWYRTTVTTARTAFNLACRRSAECHRAAPGESWHRISRLAALLRRHPVSGTEPGVHAKPVRVTLDVTSLVNIVNDAGYDYDPYRQLDAAARAYLKHRDATPLLRLYAQDIGYDYSDYNAAATYYSDGQYFAVGCSDYPQLFDMRASRSQRRAQFHRAVRRYPAQAFAPFTVHEWVGVDPFTETYHACTAWPKQRHRNDPPVPHGRPLDPSHVPVLILNGEFDSLTPAAGGAHIHRQIGSASRHIVTANTVHLVGLDDHYGCGERLVRRFITTPSALHTMSDGCAAKVPTIPAIGNFPRTVRQAKPVNGSGSKRLRRRVAVAVAAARDAATRWNYVDGNHDLGLRGGTVSYRDGNGNDRVADLHHARWTTDSAVHGHVAFSPNALSGHGVVTITEHGHHAVRCQIRWSGGPTTVVAHGHQLIAP